MSREQQLEALLGATRPHAVAGRIAGDVAHDFNNSLAIIAGSLDLLEHRIGAAAEARQQNLMPLLVRARDAVQRAADLTSGLHALSRLRPEAARPTDLGLLVAALMPLLGCVLGRRVRLHVAVSPDLRPARIDPGRLKAALVALCLNAREAMADGGDVTLDLAPESGAGGYFARLRLSDSGVGMTREVAERATEPFFTTKGPAAVGLGLSEVVAFVAEQGGQLDIDSTPGAGTSVSLLLPCADLPDEESPDPGQGTTGDG
jgi:signal transduction histidine kinase